MSDFPEKNQPIEPAENPAEAPAEDASEFKDEYAGFETVFGDPAEHRQKKPRGKNRRVVTAVAACLAVALLAGGIFAVIRLIPEKETDDSSAVSSSQEISLLKLDEDQINAVTVNNSHGSFRLLATHTEESSDESDSTPTVTTTWSVEGIDASLTSSGSISTIVSNLTDLTALQQISGRTVEECGLSSPAYSAVIEASDGTYTVTAGAESFDGLGYYTTVSGVEGIYLVDGSLFAGMDFELLDLADTASLAGVDVSTVSEEYLSDSDTLSTFDSITVTGKNFPQPLVIVPNNDDKLSAYLPYAVSSPEVRLADGVDSLLTVFSSGLSVSGVYALDVKPATLKQFGLDQPYLTISIKVGDVSRAFRISAVQQDGNYAVIADDSVVVKSVSASSLPFVDYTAESFYGKQVYMSSITELSNMVFTTPDFSHSFDIVYDDSEDAEEEFVISCDGVKLTASYFQNLYQTFVSLTAADFETVSSDATAALTITLTYVSDGSKKTIAFYPSSATKHLYTVDGKPMGRVGTSELTRFIRQIERVAAGQDIS